MKQLLIIAILCLMLGACAQSKKVLYTTEYTTQNQFEADKDYCNNKALDASNDEDFQYHEQIEIWIKVFEGCMEIKGYETSS